MPVHGTSARFYWHTRDWSPYVESADLAMTRSVAEHRPLSGGAVVRKLGHRNHAITLGGTAWEAATVDANAWARFDESASRPWAYLPNGDAVGSIAYCGLALDNNEQRVAGDDIVRLPIGLVGTDKLDRGVVLRALAAGGTSPGSSVDNSAESTNGGAAYLLCTAISGAAAELTVTVQDSANNVDWATLVAMTALTAVGSEQKLVAGTVRRYLRVIWTLTGTTPAATWFLAFGRR